MDRIVMLRASNQVLCNVWSYNIYDLMLHPWITVTLYDKYISVQLY